MTFRHRGRYTHLAGCALTVALALILIWYGAMLALLAAKVSPHTINTISGYRGFYNDLAGLRPADFTTPVRLVAGLVGFVAFCLFLSLAAHQLVSRDRGRADVTISEQDDGTTTVRPRAIERLAEISARSHNDVTAASGYLHDDQLDVDIDIRQAGNAAHVLRLVAVRVLDALAGHDLPPVTVNVTVTGYRPPTRRQLS